MGPERIRAWLNRAGPSVDRVHAVFEQLGVRDTVCNWARDELVHGDGASTVADALQEHCDDLGTAARYTLQMVTSDGRVLSSKVCRATPIDGDEKELLGKVEDATLAGALSQLLRHQEAMARMYIGANSGILHNMQAVLKLQAEQLQDYAQQAKEANKRARAAEVRAASGDENAPIDDVESVARAEAITKIGDAVSQYVIPIVAGKLNGAMS